MGTREVLVFFGFRAQLPLYQRFIQLHTMFQYYVENFPFVIVTVGLFGLDYGNDKCLKFRVVDEIDIIRVREKTVGKSEKNSGIKFRR